MRNANDVPQRVRGGACNLIPLCLMKPRAATQPAARAASQQALLGNSSMVEQRTLTPSILVRIQVPQPILFSQ